MVDTNMSSQVEFFLSGQRMRNKDTFSKPVMPSIIVHHGGPMLIVALFFFAIPRQV